MSPVTAIALASGAVAVAGITSHAFHAWLRQRERERLSLLDRETLTKRLDDFEKRWLEVKMFMGNNARR